MADIRNLVSGRVTIAAHESAAQYLLPAPLTAFYRQHANVAIKTRLCDGDEIAHLVAERDADLGFGIRQVRVHDLRAETLLNDALVLVAAPGHPLAQKGEAILTDLAHHRFFIHSRRTPMIGLVERLFADHEIPFNVAAELANFETIKQFVASGGGLAIVPSSVARADIEGGRLVVIPVEHLQIDRPIEVIYSETSPLLPAPATLLTLLRGWRWERRPVLAPPGRKRRAGRALGALAAPHDERPSSDD